jgi:peroxiredoxin
MRARQTTTTVAVMMAVIAMVSASTASASDLADPLKSLNLLAYRAGTKPPDFSSRTAAGQAVSLAGLRGKVVILNFWASWCLECRGEMPAFERLYHDFSSRGFIVVAVNAREKAAVIERYAKELNLSFPLVLDGDGEIYRAYGVIGFPTTFMIGRDGRALGLAVGPRAWNSAAAREMVTSLLAE